MKFTNIDVEALSPPYRTPSRRWLLTENNKGVLPLGKVGMLAAGGGVGKTMALTQLALAVATGQQWLDHFDTPADDENFGILLALGEEDDEEINRRLSVAAKGIGLTAKQAHIAMSRIRPLALAGQPAAFQIMHPNTKEPEHTDFLRELQNELHNANHPWKLIILDPLSRFAGSGAETYSSAATRFVEALETLTKVPGNPTVLVAHHTTKAARQGSSANDTTAARGSSGLTDGVRWVATMRAENDSVVMEFTKSNYSALPKPLVLRRTEGGALTASDTPRAGSGYEGIFGRLAEEFERDEKQLKSNKSLTTTVRRTTK